MSTATRTADPLGGVPAGASRTLSVPRRLAAAGWAVLAAVLAVLLARYWNGPPYSPDSWGYYELSRHLGGDFFRVDSWRSYQSTEPYGLSFGPLWPVLWGGTAALTRTGAHAGLLAAVGCVLGTAAALSALGRRVGVRGLGPLVTVGLLAFPPYLDEMLAARTFPLAGLLLSLLVLALVGTDRRPGPAWPAVGAVTGALVLTRPGLLFAVPLLAVLLLVTHRRQWRQLLGAGLVLAAVLTPWAVYGLAHFGTPFPGDNRIVVAAVPQLYFSDVLDLDRVPTYADDPTGWLARLAGNVPGTATEVLRAAILAPTVVLTAGGLLLLHRWWAVRPAPGWLPVLLIVLPTFVAEVTFAELSTGYRDHRYLSLVVLLLVLTSVVLLYRTPVPARLAGRTVGVAGAGLAVALLALPAAWALTFQFDTVPPQPHALDGGPVEQELRRCQDDGTTLAMRSGTLTARHSALTGARTANLPHNFAQLTPAQRRNWITTYGIGQLYLPPVGAAPEHVRPDDEPLTLLAAAARVTPDRCATIGRLYRVTP
ncbi:hypothetical protein [Micromonospora auratinigra]|uniref:4-amino-4-deoxy-L-arabinose transferase n=1 Tax=Micromonospora auratinigra TaxID=261654 RepID=A0A1A8Z1E0_9ACTN|nr:hypothetical protein [Micromonospora auratinigra]SBT37704.1 4-amino-4-deoxy-L-arabinose transferase [Micromonospora auratinigra]